VPASAYTWANPNSNITSSPDPSVRFWKEYIDFVVGVWQDPFGNLQVPGTSTCSYGPDFTAGNFEFRRPGVSISGPDSTFTSTVLVALHPQLPTAAPGYTSAPTVSFNGTNGSGSGCNCHHFRRPRSPPSL
jgi:hypothetical protein